MARRPAAEHPGRFERRKAPRQGRSRSTVDSIKQATLELAAQEGFAGLGTGRIAETAGVSIGSLYQYFPNREAIFVALYEQTSSSMAREMRAMVADIIDIPVGRAIPRVIARLVDMHAGNRLTLVDLRAQVPELRLDDRSTSFAALVRGAIRIYLEQKAPRLPAPELERKLFMIEHMIETCIRAYVALRPPQFPRDAFVAELSGVLTHYIDSFVEPARRAAPH